MNNDNEKLLPNIRMDGAAKHLLEEIEKGNVKNGDVWPVNDKHDERCIWTAETARIALNSTKPRKR